MTAEDIQALILNLFTHISQRRNEGDRSKKNDFPWSQKLVLEAQLGVRSGSLGSQPQKMCNREKAFPVRKHLIFKVA